jgi:signal transduction histidine kinase/CheY-like chemotaxis protein/PAS domain-containing protein
LTPSLVRLIRRHRNALEHGLARELALALGPDRAQAESEALLSALSGALASSRARPARTVILEAARRWAGMGADPCVIGRAMLTLILPPEISRGLPAATDPWPVLEHSLAPLIDTVPAPLLILDRERHVRFSNQAFTASYGAAPEALRGRALNDLLHAECRDWVERQLRADSPLGARVQLGRVRLALAPADELLATGVQLVHAGALAGWYLVLARKPEQAFADPSMAELLQHEKRQKEKFGALLTVSHAVVNSLELNTILETIAQQVREVIQTDECTVFLFDEAEQMLRPVVCDVERYRDEMMAVRLRMGEGITGAVALAGRGEIVNGAEQDPRAVQVPGTPEERSSLLCAPLVTREKVVGVITLVRTGGRSFVGEDLELATLFAGQCSAAIANARLYEDMRAAFVELRETQAQLVQSAKLNALGEMAGGVAHDFNNILAAILGRTQLLLQTANEPESRRQLQVVEQAALDGAHTVRRVQEFTRVRHDERFEALDVNEVLREVVELTRPAWEAGAKRNGVTLDVELDLAASQPIAGNGSELREVFTNLVLNAVDAMPWGGEIRIATESEGGEVRVSIRDTGIGMDDETRGKIFDPFFTTKTVQGTGLGLSVAYGIVTRHHGSITVESERHLGTEFTLRFPAGAPAETEAPPPPRGPLPRLRVLVVDDEEPVLSVTADLLRLMGQDVEVALGGAAGLERFAGMEFDAVFSDLGMPEVNGWDLALAVKSRRPDVAVVMVTGWGFQLEEVTTQAHGVDMVMAKPFSMEDLDRVLRQLGDTLRARGRAA